MEDDVGVDVERLADVVLDEAGAGVEVLAPTRREVVDNRHLVTAGEQCVDDVRADEPGASGDDRPHARNRSARL